MEYKIHKSGKIRGYKTKYKDGISYTLSINYSEEEDFGICLDIPEEDWEDIINMITILSKAKADIYVEDETDKEVDRKYNEYESRWYIKLLRKIEDITLQVSPFEWRVSIFWVSRPILDRKELSYRVCKGFRFLFITVTW